MHHFSANKDKHFQDGEEEISLLFVGKASLVPCNRKWLTREPCTQDIETWHSFDIDLIDVAFRLQPIVIFI
jgi:hypothetical protein